MMEFDHLSTADLAQRSKHATVERIAERARETFGTEEKAQQWLRRRTTALSGSSPLEALSAGDNGVQTVVDLLNRIDHGLAV